MAWGRFGDTAHSHGKVLRAQAKDELRGAAIWGVVTLCTSWSTQEGKDWWVSESACRRIAGPTYRQVMKEAQVAGFVRPGRHRRRGENGWLIDDSDPELLHIRTKEEVDRDREKSRATRQNGATRDVRLRDGDQCRYCGKTVEWNDRVSARAGTYDHPDPDPTRRDVFVVCCKECNNAKYNRTVDQWVQAGGRPLLPVPDQPYIGPVTAEKYTVAPSDPPTARTPTSSDDAATPRPGSQPEPATPESAAVGATGGTTTGQLDLPDLAPTKPRGADLPPSGRDGPGRDGPDRVRSVPPAVADPSPRSRDGPRGRRGSRSRSRRSR